MKKILIALDYNPTAEKVAEKGFAFAKEMNAQVILLHVVTEPLYYSSTLYSPVMGFDGFNQIDYVQPDVMTAITKHAFRFLNHVKSHLGDENILTEVIEGDVVDVIIDTAKYSKVEAIVMGSHSRKWLEDIVLGSVTKNVLHQTDIPMYIIPTNIISV